MFQFLLMRHEISPYYIYINGLSMKSFDLIHIFILDKSLFVSSSEVDNGGLGGF